MGIRAHLREGRNLHGILLPADAQAKMNQMQDKSTHEKWAPEFVGKLSVVKEAANPEAAKPKSAPVSQPAPDASEGALPPPPPLRGQGGTADQAVGGHDDLTLIEGVGESMQEKLVDAGYTTFESIAEIKPTVLDETIIGISEDSAKGLIKQSKVLAKKKSKGKL